MSTVYFIWGILPVTLFFLSIRAGFRKAVKAPGREYPTDYFRQALFCSLTLAIAIGFDKLFFDSLFEMLPVDEKGKTIVRWCLYPGILAICAKVQQIFIDKEERKRAEERRARQMKFASR